MLGGVLVAAIAVVAIIVVIGQSGTDKPVSKAEGTTQANTLFAGIPQTGNVLGGTRRRRSRSRSTSTCSAPSASACARRACPTS